MPISMKDVLSPRMGPQILKPDTVDDDVAACSEASVLAVNEDIDVTLAQFDQMLAHKLEKAVTRLERSFKRSLAEALSGKQYFDISAQPDPVGVSINVDDQMRSSETKLSEHPVVQETNESAAIQVRESVNMTASMQRSRSKLPFKISQSHANEDEVPKTWSERVENMIHRPWFETLFAFLILLNAIVMACEAQYAGLHLAYELDHFTAAKLPDAEQLWLDAPIAFEFFSWFFGIAFTCELFLKAVGMRREFFCHAWNWIDTALVLLWMSARIGTVLPIDPNILRLARLARLMRLIRLAGTIQGLDSLYLISTSLTSCFEILGWTVALFVLIQATLALFLTNLLTDLYFGNEAFDLKERQSLYTYFGTFTRSMYSFFELTLANWPPIQRLLAENLSEWFMVMGVMHKLTFGFAFVGVINGVFMQETFKVASTDDRVMLRRSERMINTHAKKMTMFFEEADANGSGVIDRAEFKMLVAQPAVSMWLSSMELDAKDGDLLFSLLDDGDGHLTLDEVVRGVAKLKGSARSIDVVQVLKELEKLKASISNDSRIAQRPPL